MGLIGISVMYPKTQNRVHITGFLFTANKKGGILSGVALAGGIGCSQPSKSLTRLSMRSDWLMPLATAASRMSEMVAGCRRKVTALRVSLPLGGRPGDFVVVMFLKDLDE